MKDYRIARGQQREDGSRPSAPSAASKAIGQGLGRVGTATVKTVVDLR